VLAVRFCALESWPVLPRPWSALNMPGGWLVSACEAVLGLGWWWDTGTEKADEGYEEELRLGRCVVGKRESADFGAFVFPASGSVEVAGRSGGSWPWRGCSHGDFLAFVHGVLMALV
jgi:hypothetical protein